MNSQETELAFEEILNAIYELEDKVLALEKEFVR